MFSVKFSCYWLSLITLQLTGDIKLVYSQCTGCSSYATCDVTYVNDAIYGCGGVFESGNGPSDGSYLCATGYEVCPSYARTAELGLTKLICGNTPSGKFFATLQSSGTGLNCDTVGNDDVYGCADDTAGGNYWYYSDNESGGGFNCGPLIALVGTLSAGNGWDCNGCDGTDEAIKMIHTNATTGGILCCTKATTNPIAAPTNSPTSGPTDPSAAPSLSPTPAPVQPPSNAPYFTPSQSPSYAPAIGPTNSPTNVKTSPPTLKPVTASPVTAKPVTAAPVTAKPVTASPATTTTLNPTAAPISSPSAAPTNPGQDDNHASTLYNGIWLNYVCMAIFGFLAFF